MAREKKTENKESSFREFTFKGKEITFSGRIYPDLKKSLDKVDITPMNLTINGVISIKGCRLMQSDKNTWIVFPQYKDSKGNYQSYVYVDKAYSEAELDKVAAAAEKQSNEHQEDHRRRSRLR